VARIARACQTPPGWRLPIRPPGSKRRTAARRQRDRQPTTDVA